jgi:substrate-binding family protein
LPVIVSDHCVEIEGAMSLRSAAAWVTVWLLAALAAAADRVQLLTGIPYIVLDGDIQNASEMLRKLGTILGEDRRGRDLRNIAEHAVAALRGELLISPADKRPRVYYGRGFDGLETGTAGALQMEDIEQAGAINVAAAAGPRGAVIRITQAQLLAWNPAVIIAEDRGFADELRRSPSWSALKAVQGKRIYVQPVQPFGWIDDPPGVNRMVGLYWLSALLYPGDQPDLGTSVRDFYDKFYGIKLDDKQLAALIHSAEAKPGEFSQTTAGPPLLAPGITVTPGSLDHLPSAPGPNVPVPGHMAPAGRGGIAVPATPPSPPSSGRPAPPAKPLRQQNP